MEIELRKIKVRDICEGYFNDEEEGVVGYDERLNIRPKYQREFVYDDKKRDAVIRTIINEWPLNVMYWCKTGEDSYEVMDGQQRTISFCEYVDGNFSVDGMIFDNQPQDIREKILDYELFVYVCDGTESEKLNWFKIINIAGEKLTDQELRNAVYAGPWTATAKRYFSKTNCPAYQLAKDYMSGSPIRQDYLQTVISWIADRDGLKDIESYMSINQYNESANELWVYFKNVINWVQTTFPKYRKEMKGLPWGILYNKYKDVYYNTDELEAKIKTMLKENIDDISNVKGIYEYLLSGDVKHLHIRAFTDKQKRKAYEKQGGICPKCGKHFEIDEMEGDHITPWSIGGPTNDDNCQMLCKDCNRRKSDI